MAAQDQRLLQWREQFDQQCAQRGFDLFGLGQFFILDLALQCIEQRLRRFYASVRCQQCGFELFVQFVADFCADKKRGEIRGGFRQPGFQARNPGVLLLCRGRCCRYDLLGCFGHNRWRGLHGDIGRRRCDAVLRRRRRVFGFFLEETKHWECTRKCLEACEQADTIGNSFNPAHSF